MFETDDVIDLSDVIETFDVDENRRQLEVQLEDIHSDSCERFIDNFKMLYTRFASLQRQEPRDPDVCEEAKDLFYGIASMYIDRIADEFGITVDDQYLQDNWEELPSIALQFYLFFVLDLRSNLFHVLINFISFNMEAIVDHFEERRQRKDSVTEVNRSMENPDVALIASNIYDVVDWAMEQMEPTMFFDYMEKSYVALDPMKRMYDEGTIDGEFVSSLASILKENIALKGRVCFDIICKLKGYAFEN